MNMKSIKEKIFIFRQLFTGLTHVYGTYSLFTGHVRQIKAYVSNDVILSHLKGKQPYGVYLLMKNRTRAVVVDFDEDNSMLPIEFVGAAKHYGLPAYIERSKSKGYHVWIFFTQTGVLASKARLVVRNILNEIEKPNIEIFPKQDELNKNICYGNFINAPLFGGKVPEGRTVFVDPLNYMRPYRNQWDFLARVHRVSESVLDEIIDINELDREPISYTTFNNPITPEYDKHAKASFGLLPCAQRMLKEGVSSYQRVCCFRLAVHLKKLGVPFDITLAILSAWALKNRPKYERRKITKNEIISQAKAAYEKNYSGYGCNDNAIRPYCDSTCSVYKKMMGK